MRLRHIFSPLAAMSVATCVMPVGDVPARISTQGIEPKLATDLDVFKKEQALTGIKSRFFRYTGTIPSKKPFNDYCNRNPGDCTAPANGNAYLPTTPKLFELLDRVNRDVNRRMKPAADPAQYGVYDYWTVPIALEDGTLRGDCDDYALTKRRALEPFLPKEAMSVAFIDIYHKGAYQGSHAVLVVRTLEGDYILDNLSDNLKFPGDNKTYVYRGITDPNDQTKWLKVDVPDAAQTRFDARYMASALKHGSVFQKPAVFAYTMDDLKISQLSEEKPKTPLQDNIPMRLSSQNFAQYALLQR